MNKVAWSRRWTDRNASTDFAITAKNAATDGTGRRSRTQHGLALCTLAWQAKWRGEMDRAMGFCLSAETHLPERENAEARAQIYSILACVHFSRNRFDLSKSALERGLWLLRETPAEAVNEAMVDLLLCQARVQLHTGERARAGITLGRAKEICTDEMLPYVEYSTAVWLLADGDAEAARIRAGAAYEKAMENGNRLIIPYLRILIASCDIRLGRLQDAQESLQSALVVAEDDDDDCMRCTTSRVLAELEIARGNLNEGKIYLEQAARLAKSLNHSFERKRIALQLADLFESLKQFSKAVQQHKLAWRLQNETRMS